MGKNLADAMWSFSDIDNRQVGPNKRERQKRPPSDRPDNANRPTGNTNRTRILTRGTIQRPRTWLCPKINLS
jgi:hypothetical protein